MEYLENIYPHCKSTLLLDVVPRLLLLPQYKAKTILQLQNFHPVFLSTGVHFSSSLECLTEIIKREGYQGTLRLVPITISYYLSKGLFKRLTKEKIHKIFESKLKGDDYRNLSKFKKSVRRSFYEGIPDYLSAVIFYPILKIMILLHADLGPDYMFDGVYDCLKKTIKSSGFSSLYGGLGISLTCLFFYRLVYFWVFYHVPSRNFSGNRWSDKEKFWLSHIIANLSGYVIYPFDTCKGIYMMQSLDSGDEGVRRDWKLNGYTQGFGMNLFGNILIGVYSSFFR